MKIAVITGSAIRIGKAIAEHLLGNGYFLLLHANTSIKNLQAWAQAHPCASNILGIIEGDLSTEQGQEYFCQQVKALVPHVDVVVHNASLFRPEAFHSITRQSFREMQGINLEAPYFITQSLLPLLNKSENPCIISIIDALWDRPRSHYSHYSVGKAGLAILTKGLARELAPHIRVNAISPGLILFQPFHTAEERTTTLEKIPLKQAGDAIDIAEAVLFLAKSKYITGEILNVDGGRSLV